MSIDKDSLSFGARIELDNIATAEKEFLELIGRLDRMVKKNPIALSTKIEPLVKFKDDQGNIAKTESAINSIANRMKELRIDWNKMKTTKMWVPEFDTKGNKIGEKLSKDAEEIRAEYLQLANTLRTHGASLEQITSKTISAIDKEIRAEERKAEKSRNAWAQKRAILSDEEKTTEQVSAKIKVRMQELSKQEPGSSKWKKNADEIVRLNALLDELKRKQADVLRKNAGAMPEGTMGEISAKMREYQNLMQNSKFGGSNFRHAVIEIDRLKTKMEGFNKVLANMESSRQFANAMNLTANTISNISTLIGVFQQRVDSLKVGSDKWREAADAVASYSAEMKKAQEFAQTYQNKAFAGVKYADRDKEIKDIQTLREWIDKYNAKLNEMRINNTLYDNKGDFSAAAVKALKDRAVAVQMLEEKLNSCDNIAQKFAENTRNRVNALKQMHDALNANEKNVAGLTQKLQFYNSMIDKREYGSDKWMKSAEQVRRLSDELSRASQMLQDYQNKAFAGLSADMTKGQVEKITDWRDKMRGAEEQFNRLKALGQAYNSDGSLTAQANDSIKDRMHYIREINKLISTANEAQIIREKEISKIIESRKAKVDKQKDEQRAIQDRIAKLKEERKILNQKEDNIKAINAKLSVVRERLDSAKIGSAEFNKYLAEANRLSEKLAETQKKVKPNPQAAEQFRGLTSAIREQETYVSRLVKRLAVYASFQQATQFIQNIRNVTAEFELQRVSLGAIIQDQQKADLLFSQIKTFALQSPVSILDMTKYVKQVAAYRIETDKLFDTTKRLTDISVGLGVDMSRIVLAYGQVKAASYLRASELRQFTEAGIPLLDALAQKFTELEGRVVSTNDVMKRISERGVDFKTLDEVLMGMTEKGGIFYNMQIKQGNTLHGMYAKLTDAVQVMYDKIGSGGFINGGMKMAAEFLTTLTKNYNATAVALTTLIAGVVLYKAAQNGATAIENRLTNATHNRRRAQEMLLLVQKHGTAADIAKAQSALATAQSEEIAAEKEVMAINKKTGAWARMKAMVSSSTAWGSIFSGLAWGAVIATISAAVFWVVKLISEMGRLKKQLDEIKNNTGMEQSKMVANFESLAKQAVDTSHGLKAQQDALEELKRTYGQMLPVQDLTIEKLTEMKGNYDNLTASVAEYIRQLQVQKGMEAINTQFGDKMIGQERDLRKYLTHDIGMSDEQTDRIIANFKRIVEQCGDVRQAYREAMSLEGFNTSQDAFRNGFKFNPNHVNDTFARLGGTIIDMKRQIESFNKSMDATYSKLGYFAEYVTEAKNKINNFATTTKVGTFEYDQEIAQENIQSYLTALAKALGDAQADSKVKIKLSDFIQWNGDNVANVNWEGFEKAIAGLNSKFQKPLQSMAEVVKKVYHQFIPEDSVVFMVNKKFEALAKHHGILDKVKSNFMGMSQDLEEYRKTINETAKKYAQAVVNLQHAIAMGNVGGSLAFGKVEETKEKLAEAEKMLKFYNDMAKALGTEDVTKKKRTSKESDPRLSELKERISLTKRLYDEYKNLEKDLGGADAAAQMEKLYKNTIESLESASKKYGFTFSRPFNSADLKKNLEEFKKAMEKLPKKVFPKIGIDIDELNKQIADVDFKVLQDAIERKLKESAEKLAQSKAAKEFFDKVFEQSGDKEFAIRVTTSVYGTNGENVFKDMVDNLRAQFDTIDDSAKALFDGVFKNVVNESAQTINWAKLEQDFEKYKDKIVESRRDGIRKMIEDGKKAEGEQILSWEKEYAKVKSYEARRTEITKRETANRAKIANNPNLTAEDKVRLNKASHDKELREKTDVDIEEFTNSERYIRAFKNVADQSTESLKLLRQELQKLIDAGKFTNPESIKPLIESIENIDNTLDERGFGNQLAKGITGYLDAYKKYREAKAELDKTMADPKSTDKQKKDATQNVADALTGLKKSFNDTIEGMNAIGDAAQNLASFLGEVKDALGIMDDSVEADVFDGAIKGLQTMSTTISMISSAMVAFNLICDANPVVGIATALAAAGMIAWKMIESIKIGNINRQLKQEKLIIESLEHAYERLDKAAAECFGTEYIDNYQARVTQLKAEQASYEKQAQLERQKGKKADKEAIKDYENSARDSAEKLRDLQDDLVQKMLGSNVANIAQDFANSWLDAKLSFSNTVGAMKSKWKDLMKTMIVNLALSSVAKRALEPLLEQFSDMLNKGNTTEAMKLLQDEMPKKIESMDASMNAVMSAMAKAGIDYSKIREGEASGIARNFATASEESINGLTQMYNTNNYYMKSVREDVSAIRVLMRDNSDGSREERVNLLEMQNEQVNNLAKIEVHTASIAYNAAESAKRAVEIAEQLRRVVDSTNGKSAIRVKM